MSKVFITLELKGHCVETAAKNEFKRLMDIYFQSQADQDPILEKQIGILRDFIEKSDFRKLRSSDERLSGAKECTVFIKCDKDGEPEIIF